MASLVTRRALRVYAALSQLRPGSDEQGGANETPEAASLGKMPTTSVRRLISPLRRSIGLMWCAG
jgi:hypothetical protein